MESSSRWARQARLCSSLCWSLDGDGTHYPCLVTSAALTLFSDNPPFQGPGVTLQGTPSSSLLIGKHMFGAFSGGGKLGMELTAPQGVLFPADTRLGFHSAQLASVPRRLGTPAPPGLCAKTIPSEGGAGEVPVPPHCPQPRGPSSTH